MVQWLQTKLVTMRMWVQLLVLFSGLRIRCCLELWCRLQMQLRSLVVVAVAQAGCCSSDSTSSLGTCIYCRCSPKKKRGKKKNPIYSNIKIINYLGINALCMCIYIYIF